MLPSIARRVDRSASLRAGPAERPVLRSGSVWTPRMAPLVTASVKGFEFPETPQPLVGLHPGNCRKSARRDSIRGVTTADEFEVWFDKGVTDGLPVVPPTRARVERMLAGIY